jgi:hypothetical protein
LAKEHRNTLFGGKQENRGKLKITHNQTIFETSNTDIRDQRGRLQITRWVWKKLKKIFFSEIL